MTSPRLSRVWQIFLKNKWKETRPWIFVGLVLSAVCFISYNIGKVVMPFAEIGDSFIVILDQIILGFILLAILCFVGFLLFEIVKLFVLWLRSNWRKAKSQARREMRR